MKLKILALALASCLFGVPAMAQDPADQPDMGSGYEPMDVPADAPDYYMPPDNIPDYDDPMDQPDQDTPIDQPDPENPEEPSGDDVPTDLPPGEPFPDGPVF